MKQLVISIIILLCLPVYAQRPKKAVSNATRCEATTLKGTRCKLEKIEGMRYCKVHAAKDPKIAQCKAITKKGTRCKKPAKKKGYCTQHYKKCKR